MSALGIERATFRLLAQRSNALTTRPPQNHSIFISDHSPVQLDIRFPDSTVSQSVWRFDPLRLSSSAFKKYISTHIDVSLQINCTPDVSHSTVRESLKWYLRGQIISYTAYDNKQRTKRLSERSQLILDVDNRYASSPIPELYKETATPIGIWQYFHWTSGAASV